MGYHVPVLLTETIDALAVQPDGVYMDGTLGGAGHASEIAKRLTDGHLYGFDQDADAIAEASKRLAPYAEHVTVIHENFVRAAEVLRAKDITALNGILLDLGVSSHQFDDAERGFSYREDAPLDMRMDVTRDVSAQTIVNEYSETELFHIIRDYGEEPFAKNIAKHIVKRRETSRIETTMDLVEIIDNAIPKRVRVKGGHPAKKTFQALRIACNNELDVLQEALEPLLQLLVPGGRLAIITFHSLEDRMVKQTFRTWENPCTCPPSFPVCTCGKKSMGHVLFRKAVTASEEELEQNRRARSARLRVFERA